MAHSKGNWSLGKTGGTVITDSGEDFPDKSSGHTETDYYGGFLIGESILRKDDAKLIAAAPDLLEACQSLLKRNEQLYAMVEYPREDMSGETSLKLAKAAIKKATA